MGLSFSPSANSRVTLHSTACLRRAQTTSRISSASSRILERWPRNELVTTRWKKRHKLHNPSFNFFHSLALPFYSISQETEAVTSVNGTLKRCFSYFSIDLVFMGLLMLCFVCWLALPQAVVAVLKLLFSISRLRRRSIEFSFSLENLNRLFMQIEVCSDGVC